MLWVLNDAMQTIKALRKQYSKNISSTSPVKLSAQRIYITDPPATRDTHCNVVMEAKGWKLSKCPAKSITCIMMDLDHGITRQLCGHFHETTTREKQDSEEVDKSSKEAFMLSFV